jgi:hypothetical protein
MIENMEAATRKVNGWPAWKLQSFGIFRVIPSTSPLGSLPAASLDDLDCWEQG